MDIMSLIAEQRILEAQEQGAFDHLPGAGRPMELEDDSSIPEDLRLAYKVLRNAGYAPPEVEARKEAQSILEFLNTCTDEQEKVRQMRKLDLVLSRISTLRGRPVSVTDVSPYYDQLAQKITLPNKS